MYNSAQLLVLILFIANIYSAPVPDKNDDVEILPSNSTVMLVPFGLGVETQFQNGEELMKSINDAFDEMRKRTFAMLFKNFKPPEIDPSKANTTSVTKVVNGKTYVMNETTYSNDDDKSRSLYKVRVVEIKSGNKNDKNVANELKERIEDFSKK